MYHRFFVTIPRIKQAASVVQNRLQHLTDEGTLLYTCAVDLDLGRKGDAYQYVAYTKEPFVDLEDAAEILNTPGWNVTIETIREVSEQTVDFLSSRFEIGVWESHLKILVLREEDEISDWDTESESEDENCDTTPVIENLRDSTRDAASRAFTRLWDTTCSLVGYFLTIIYRNIRGLQDSEN
jgi:hypothetical protein